MAKVIVITGAAEGLGRALARRLSKGGNTVVLLGRTAATLQAVADEIGAQAHVVVCDIASPDSVRSAFATIAARFPTIDVMINNAARMERATITDATDEQIFGIIGTNVIGTILCCRAAIPLLKRGGQIINVSSGAADRYVPALTLYSTSKVGVERLSNVLAEELAPRDIGVTMVRAGAMIDDRAEFESDTVARRRAVSVGFDINNPPPATEFVNAAEIFAELIELPLDLRVNSIVLKARAVPKGQ